MALLNAMQVGRAWRRAWVSAALLVSLCLVPRSAAANGAAPAGEYQIKAVFLFNFAQFAEWPARSFTGEKSPFVIGILGDDPFGSYLDEVVKDEKIGARPLVVRRRQEIRELEDCHILFVSRSESARLDQIVATLKGRGILTISDAEAFTRVGGVVRFVMEGGKVRLRINVEAAKAAGLTISSKILRSSTIVTTGKD
jgi:hypothetical protein